MKRGDTISYGFNLLLLLFVALLPFSTGLMVTHISGPDMSIGAVIYGLNVLVASLALSLQMSYIAHQPQLVVDELADETLNRLTRRRWIAIGVGAFAVILAFVEPLLAITLYLIEALLVVVLPLLGAHRSRRKTAR